MGHAVQVSFDLKLQEPPGQGGEYGTSVERRRAIHTLPFKISFLPTTLLTIAMLPHVIRNQSV